MEGCLTVVYNSKERHFPLNKTSIGVGRIYVKLYCDGLETVAIDKEHVEDAVSVTEVLRAIVHGAGGIMPS